MIDFGVASSALPGESESGDRYVVRELRNGVLVAAIDGLGHGPEAASAAKQVVTLLNTFPSTDLVSLVQYCHDRLRRTRGVVMTLASIDFPTARVTWTGVGNVEGVIFHEGSHTARGDKDFVLLRGGIVGHHLPALEPFGADIAPGDAMVLATDGISRDFIGTRLGTLSAQRIADVILRQHAIGTDDALVLAIRYQGHGDERR